MACRRLSGWTAYRLDRGGNIGLFDVGNNQPIPLAAFPSEPHWSAIAFSPNGRLLMAATSDGRLAIAPCEDLDRAEVHSLARRIDVSVLRFSSDGRRLAIVSRKDDQLLVLAFPALNELFQNSLTDNQNAALSPDGRFVALDRGRDVLVFDVETGLLLAESIQHHEETISDVLFVARGERIVTTGGDRTVRTWDWRHAAAPELVGVHTSGYPESVAVTPDERTLFTCSRAGEVILWSLPARQKLFTLVQSGDRTLEMALSAKGRVLVTIHDDLQLRWIPLVTQDQEMTTMRP